MGKHRARDLLRHFADRHRDCCHCDRVDIVVLVALPHGTRYSHVGTAGHTDGGFLPDARRAGIHGGGPLVRGGVALAGRRSDPCS